MCVYLRGDGAGRRREMGRARRHEETDTGQDWKKKEDGHRFVTPAKVQDRQRQGR